MINIEEEKIEHFKFIEVKFESDEIEKLEKSIKREKLIFVEFILDLILVIISIIKIILGFVCLIIINRSEIVRSISNDLIENFNTGYFTKFRECPSPYEISSEENKRRLSDNLISFGRWEGMRKGCGKNDNGNIKVSVQKDDKCKKDEKTLQSISAREIYIYKGISICAETKGNYYDLLFNNDSVIKENEDCPEGKKLCGYIDTLKNKLCLDKDKECPISYISFSVEKPRNITHLEKIEGKGINLYYSNNPYENSTEIPHISNAFRISDEKVCSVPNLYHSNTDKLFPLDGFKKDYADNCVITEDFTQQHTQDFGVRYHELNQINSYDLYKENKIIDAIENSELVHYGLNTTDYYNNFLHIYVRKHYGFDRECLKKRKKFDMQSLSGIFSTGDKMETFAKWMNFNFIALAAYVHDLLELLRKCQNICKLKDCNWSTFLSLILKIVPIVLELIFGLGAFKYDDPYEEEMTCSDHVTNDNYNIMIYQLRKAGQSIKIMHDCIIAFLVLNVLFIILLFYIKWEKSNNYIYNGKKNKISNGNKPKNTKKEENKDDNNLKKGGNEAQGNETKGTVDNNSERVNINNKP